MTMRSEIYARFKITGFDIPPEQITTELGIRPRRTWKKGEPTPIARKQGKEFPVTKENYWEMPSGLGVSEDLESHVKTLMSQIQPVKAKLAEFGKKYTLELSCVIYSYDGDRPAIPFDRDLIKALAELNASIDVDLYVL